jgi:hypothetical protein
MKADNRVSKISASHINNKSRKFHRTIRKESVLTPISSVKDLAEKIKKFNKSLNDTTIVYCKGEDSNDLEKESTRAAVRLMR